jgi:hypothetical protein
MTFIVMMPDHTAGQPVTALPWLYLCSGMRRGGSTLQAQLVSALPGRTAEPTSREALRGLLGQERADGRREVLKCHEFLPEAAERARSGEVRVVYVYRDLRDVVASICRKYSLPAFSYVGGGVQAILEEDRQWRSVPGVYVARYEDMVEDLPAEVRRLAEYLGVPIDRGEAARVADQFSVDRQKTRIASAFDSGETIVGQGSDAHDRLSLLHRNHIQSGTHGAYRKVFRRHEIAALEWVCRDWLRANDYRADCGWAAQFVAYCWFRFRGFIHRLRAGAAAMLR